VIKLIHDAKTQMKILSPALSKGEGDEIRRILVGFNCGISGIAVCWRLKYE
jgi:hypothetical protein